MSTLSPFLLSRNEWESRGAFVSLGSGLAGALMGQRKYQDPPEEKGLTEKKPVRSKGKKGLTSRSGRCQGTTLSKGPPEMPTRLHVSGPPLSSSHFLCRTLTKSLSCHHPQCSSTSPCQVSTCLRDIPPAPVLLPRQSARFGSREGCFPLPASLKAACI